MAVNHSPSITSVEAWEAPTWPVAPPDPAAARVLYGREADELVVRFAEAGRRPSVVVPIATEDREDIGVLSDNDTGVVIGVQVDLLLAIVSAQHPTWARLAEPDPPAAAVGAFLADVAGLFARYGAGETPPRG